MLLSLIHISEDLSKTASGDTLSSISEDILASTYLVDTSKIDSCAAYVGTGATAVSYTHLIQGTLHDPFCRHAAVFFHQVFFPFSYTHLDVYKRQPLYSSMPS